MDQLAPPGISRDGDIPGFTTTEWAALSVHVNLALTGIAPHDLKMDTTIVDLVISELERAETK